ncbi:MAG: PIN domain-containing protein [Acidobacteria bacterium]|nr:PIN domain-containing protein [Acidobacteriota bacterium]
MICADTNCWIAYLSGQTGQDVDLLDECLARRSVVMAPVILSELLSDPLLSLQDESDLLAVQLLETRDGFWRRAGKLRAELIRRKYRPKLADTLIAQSCIDHDLPLLTRDRDFRPFTRVGRLQLL